MLYKQCSPHQGRLPPPAQSLSSSKLHTCSRHFRQSQIQSGRVPPVTVTFVRKQVEGTVRALPAELYPIYTGPEVWTQLHLTLKNPECACALLCAITLATPVSGELPVCQEQGEPVRLAVSGVSQHTSCWGILCLRRLITEQARRSTLRLKCGLDWTDRCCGDATTSCGACRSTYALWVLVQAQSLSELAAGSRTLTHH